MGGNHLLTNLVATKYKFKAKTNKKIMDVSLGINPSITKIISTC